MTWLLGIIPHISFQQSGEALGVEDSRHIFFYDKSKGVSKPCAQK